MLYRIMSKYNVIDTFTAVIWHYELPMAPLDMVPYNVQISKPHYLATVVNYSSKLFIRLAKRLD